MTQEEANQLAEEYNALVSEYNALVSENAQLRQELEISTENVYVLSQNANVVGNSVHKRVSALQKYVGTTEMDTSEVLEAIKELTEQYFTYKALSEAAKMLTKYTDEYNTRYKYYNELRRITLGYVIGLDAGIISDEGSRKKVEKAYLENTEYWLAYCTMAVMLWKSDEKEAAYRALEKSLKMNYQSSCLFYMLVNMRFKRLDAARKWYVNYLDRTDMKNPGREWRYLLQAYLMGAFGYDAEFEQLVNQNFNKMLVQAETISADLGQHFVKEAKEEAETMLHTTEAQFPALRRLSEEGKLLEKILSEAEKNQKLVDHYTELAEREDVTASDVEQRIEDVLYSLINSYEANEFKVYKEIKRNEAIMQAGGDTFAAERKIKEMFENEEKKLTFPELLFEWCFSENPTESDDKVRRFSLHYMKKWIKKGIAAFADDYRSTVPDELNVTIDGCSMRCDEGSYDRNAKELSDYYDKNKQKNLLADKQIQISGIVCIAAVLTIFVSIGTMISSHSFQPVGLVVGLLAGIAGGIFLYLRMKDMDKILAEKKRLGLKSLQGVLDEYAEWKKLYEAADGINDEAQAVFDQF